MKGKYAGNDLHCVRQATRRALMAAKNVIPDAFAPLRLEIISLLLFSCFFFSNSSSFTLVPSLSFITQAVNPETNTQATFTFKDEDHTLGNALHYILMKKYEYGKREERNWRTILIYYEVQKWPSQDTQYHIQLTQ
jgi:hypothetical protein